MRIRTIAAAVAALALPLTACGSDGGTVSQSKGSCKDAIRDLVKDPDAAGDEKPPACEGFTDAELEDMAKEVLGDELAGSLDVDAEEPAEEKPAADTSLTVGETFTYDDGLAVTVDSIREFSDFGEFDYPPEDGDTAFRINLTFDNGTKKPFSLDDLYLSVEGATNGGAAEGNYWENGSKEITGRVAPGVATNGTSDHTLAAKYGRDVVVTLGRLDEANLMADDLEWSGSIK
ncbi:hypothetical protein [Streptomyces aculeolatus]|uniref:hypothetical protein n=1 Tax=Streptomyces aculeolatus TaxID=270689 RepID=UPI001CEC2BDB|nr:hypothetical protein [Streptomyces aculeolatus]